MPQRTRARLDVLALSVARTEWELVRRGSRLIPPAAGRNQVSHPSRWTRILETVVGNMAAKTHVFIPQTS
jgi:hypothetical protein